MHEHGLRDGMYVCVGWTDIMPCDRNQMPSQIPHSSELNSRYQRLGWGCVGVGGRLWRGQSPDQEGRPEPHFCSIGQ